MGWLCGHFLVALRAQTIRDQQIDVLTLGCISILESPQIVGCFAGKPLGMWSTCGHVVVCCWSTGVFYFSTIIWNKKCSGKIQICYNQALGYLFLVGRWHRRMHKGEFRCVLPVLPAFSEPVEPCKIASLPPDLGRFGPVDLSFRVIVGCWGTQWVPNEASESCQECGKVPDCFQHASWVFIVGVVLNMMCHGIFVKGRLCNHCGLSQQIQLSHIVSRCSIALCYSSTIINYYIHEPGRSIKWKSRDVVPTRGFSEQITANPCRHGEPTFQEIAGWWKIIIPSSFCGNAFIIEIMQMNLKLIDICSMDFCFFLAFFQSGSCFVKSQVETAKRSSTLKYIYIWTSYQPTSNCMLLVLDP